MSPTQVSDVDGYNYPRSKLIHFFSCNETLAKLVNFQLEESFSIGESYFQVLHVDQSIFRKKILLLKWKIA